MPLIQGKKCKATEAKLGNDIKIDYFDDARKRRATTENNIKKEEFQSALERLKANRASAQCASSKSSAASKSGTDAEESDDLDSTMLDAPRETREELRERLMCSLQNSGVPSDAIDRVISIVERQTKALKKKLDSEERVVICRFKSYLRLD